MSSDPCFVRSRHSWEALHFSKSCHLEQNLLSWNSWAPELSPHRLLPPAAPSGYKAPYLSLFLAECHLQSKDMSTVQLWSDQGRVHWGHAFFDLRFVLLWIESQPAWFSWQLHSWAGVWWERHSFFFLSLSLFFFYLAIIKPDLCGCSCNWLHKCICRRPSFSLGWTFLSLLSIWLPNIQYTSLISSLLWFVEIIEASLGFGGKWEEGEANDYVQIDLNNEFARGI